MFVLGLYFFTYICLFWRQGDNSFALFFVIELVLGGVGMDTYFAMDWSSRDLPPTSDEVADYWRADICWCIDTFTPDRCMFESNFPVDRQTCSYAVLWNSFQKIASEYDDSEQDALFSRTALRVYRI